MREKLIFLLLFLLVFNSASSLQAQTSCDLLRPISSVAVTPATAIGGSSEDADVIALTVTMGPEPCPADPLNPGARANRRFRRAVYG